MAVLMAGGCVTLLNGWWTGAELADGIAMTGCKLVLADEPRAARLDGQDCAAQVNVFGHGDPETGLSELLAASGDSSVLPELTGDDLATIKAKLAWPDKGWDFTVYGPLFQRSPRRSNSS